MALRDQGSARDVASRRDRMLADAEAKLDEAVSAATRRFLRRIRQHVTADALTAAGEVGRPVELFEIGQARGWWTDAVDADVIHAVEAVWRTGYFDTRDGELLESSAAASRDFVANVRDRLSRTATPTVPEQAFDRARVALSDEMARGSSTQTMARRLGAEFSWDEDSRFWRSRLDELDAEVDRILDAVGPPGSQARETARANDPTVAELQRQRSEARLHIDRDESTWRQRAERIARTEATAAANAGVVDAYRVEGAGVKVWVATGDDRTRDDHLDAHGQCVPAADDFDVGGYAMFMPGDPSAPAEQVINCRCTTVAHDSCDDAGRDFGFADERIEAERTRRAEDQGGPR